MLLVAQTSAGASKVLFLLSFGFPVLSFCCWSCSIYIVVLVLFCFVCHKWLWGHDNFFFVLVYDVFFVPFDLLFVNVSIWIASFCMYVSYPVRWHVCSAYCMTMQHLCIVVSWPHSLCTSIPLEGGIGTDTGCVCSSPKNVFFTRRHPAHPVSALILHPNSRETQALWSQNHDTGSNVEPGTQQY